MGGGDHPPLDQPAHLLGDLRGNVAQNPLARNQRQAARQRGKGQGRSRNPCMKPRSVMQGKRRQYRPTLPACHHRQNRAITVQLEPMGKADVLARQMRGNLAAHHMAFGILDQRQIRPFQTFGINRHKGFGHQRMHFAPRLERAFWPNIGDHHNIQRAGFKLIQQAVTGPCFQQEPTSL